MNLTTLEKAKLHLRLSYQTEEGVSAYDSEDLLIEGYIEAASDHIAQYCERDFEEIPASVEQACLLLVGDFYRLREETVAGISVTVTKTVERLLAPYRKKLGV